MTEGSHRARLGALEPALDRASPLVQRTMAMLVDVDPRTRTRGLDAIRELFATHDAALEAIPLLLTLATSRGFPEGSALLVRISALLASIDDPPRAGPTDASARALFDALRAHLPRVLHHARTSSDPEAARIAASIASRFAEADREVEPLLVALLSGAKNADERARLLYALARIQAARRADFHARVASALHRAELDAESVAVALALAEHDPPEPLRSRLAATLRSAREQTFADPRAWGRTLDRAALDRAIAKLI